MIEPIFIGQIEFSETLYKKDFLRYYLYKKKVAILEILGLSLSAFIIAFLCSVSFIKGHWIDLTYIFVVIALLIAIIEAWNFKKVFDDIRSRSKQLPRKKEIIKVYNNRIQFDYDKNFISIFFSQIKKAKRLNDTLFLIPKEKNEWPFKLNPKEISSTFIDDLEKMTNEKIKN